MTRSLVHTLLLLVTAASMTLTAADKSRYDLTGPGETITSALAKTTGAATDRWTISRAVSAATLAPGGYFTIGTTGGTSPLALDDNCGITFGHPFAKTSYPIVSIDGTWGKPEHFFETSSTSPRFSGDSLIIVYTVPGTYAFRISAFLENNGAKIHLASELANLDAVQHAFALGFVFDPALGMSGDGCVSVGATRLLRDTTLTAQSLQTNAVSITERSTSTYGMKISLEFPRATPSSFIVSNWDYAVNADAPAYTPSDVRKLYDAVVNMSWPAVSVAPASSIIQELVVSVMDPKFGTAEFLRWDVPPTQSVENGIPFPAQFSSSVSIANMSGQGTKSVNVQLVQSGDVQTPSAVQAASAGAAAPAYLAFPLTFNAVNETKVVDLVLLCTENSVVVDSLVRPFRMCSAPVSDTGLTVRIDSLLTAAFPKVGVTFDVMKQSTRTNVFALTRNNIFLYENGLRIDDFTFGKDTTGGAGAIDLVFVLDVTGSMGNSITGVKNNIMEFADSLSTRGVNYRLAMVTFLDAVENVYDFTTSAAQFKTLVAAQFAHEGGDGPENSLDALYRATQLTFRETAKPIFIWITDANYHERDVFTSRSKQDVISRLTSLDVTVHAIGATMFQTDWYTPIIQPTGGNYYNISGNFRDILLNIGNLRGTNRYLVAYTSSAQASASKELRIVVHYAGLGGTAATTFGSGQKTASAGDISCFPNPFNPQTTIRIEMPSGVRGVVTIYNILGQQVRSFALAGVGGRMDVVWNAKNDAGSEVATGLYFVRCTSYTQDNRQLSSVAAKLLYVK